MPATYKTIDLRMYLREPKLHARLVWQELFNYYRNHGGDLDSMDNMLCDYHQIHQHLVDHQHDVASQLWWSMDDSITEMTADRNRAMSERYAIHILISHNTITIQEVNYEISQQPL